MLISAMVAAFGLTSAVPAGAQGSVGQNAVFNPSGNCNQCVGSSAFIDAYVLLSTPGLAADLCDTLYGLFVGRQGFPPYPAGGAVIDARGISGTALTCTKGSPWSEGGSSVTTPSTILLPPGTIVIPSSWVLPSNTHLVGEGDNDPYSSTPGTTIQVSGSFTAPGSMIQFASASGASGISVERLTLDGKGLGINGIVNQYAGGSNTSAGSNTYVDHVTLYRLLGVGLQVAGSANNSGPYTNITFDTGSATGLSTTVCAQITGLSATHGVRSLSCTATGYPTAAVLLDSSNNLIKDVTVAGFYSGVQVGANAVAEGNVLMNVVGNTSNKCYPTCPTPVETVHISGNMTGGNPNVTDLSIMGVTNGKQGGTYSIRDDLTSTDLTDTYVAMYVLGRQVVNGTTLVGYSRYSTSPNAVGWSFGNNYPQGSCVSGSLYSCIPTSTGANCKNPNNIQTAVWGCSGSAWKSIM
jgi:hypothetical protein